MRNVTSLLFSWVALASNPNEYPTNGGVPLCPLVLYSSENSGSFSRFVEVAYEMRPDVEAWGEYLTALEGRFREPFEKDWPSLTWRLFRVRLRESMGEKRWWYSQETIDAGQAQGRYSESHFRYDGENHQHFYKVSDSLLVPSVRIHGAQREQDTKLFVHISRVEFLGEYESLEALKQATVLGVVRGIALRIRDAKLYPIKEVRLVIPSEFADAVKEFDFESVVLGGKPWLLHHSVIADNPFKGMGDGSAFDPNAGFDAILRSIRGVLDEPIEDIQRRLEWGGDLLD